MRKYTPMACVALFMILAGCQGGFGGDRSSDYLSNYPSGGSTGGYISSTPGPTRLGGQGMLGN